MLKAGFATDSSVAAAALPEGAALGQTPGLGGETDLEGEPGEGIEASLKRHARLRFRDLQRA